MNEEFYRFRRISNLIGEFKELENQSIFFAGPDLLNDPMEGYRDIYWSGDFIVWKNLFRHYLLCLERLCSLLLLSDEDHPISKNDMPVFHGEEDFPTPTYKALFNEISNSFFENSNLTTLIKAISERSSPVRRDELFFYLKSTHALALEAIYGEYEKIGFIPKRSHKDITSDKPIKNLIEENFIGILEESLKEKGSDKGISSAFFAANKHTLSQIDLIHRFARLG